MLLEEMKKLFEGEIEPKDIAERIHELKKEGYQFMYGEKVNRLIVGEEWPLLEKGMESPYSEILSHISKELGIYDRKSYEEVDEKYNLTMY